MNENYNIRRVNKVSMITIIIVSLLVILPDLLANGFKEGLIPSLGGLL